MALVQKHGAASAIVEINCHWLCIKIMPNLIGQMACPNLVKFLNSLVPLTNPCIYSLSHDYASNFGFIHLFILGCKKYLKNTQIHILTRNMHGQAEQGHHHNSKNQLAAVLALFLKICTIISLYAMHVRLFRTTEH